MKPRARRVTIAAAVLGAGVVGVLVVAHWGAVRDHVEAWQFQLTTETETIEPNPPNPAELSAPLLSMRSGLRNLAIWSGHVVIVDRLEYLKNTFLVEDTLFSSRTSEPQSFSRTSNTRTHLRKGNALQSFTTNGWRVLEQRFPRKAYVVIRHHPGVLTTSSEGEDAGVTLEITPTVCPTLPAGCEQEAAPAE